MYILKLSKLITPNGEELKLNIQNIRLRSERYLHRLVRFICFGLTCNRNKVSGYSMYRLQSMAFNMLSTIVSKRLTGS